VVIRSALRAVGVDAVVTQIQPQSADNILGAQGPAGGGWKGVRAWCRDRAASPGLTAVLTLSDLLIVHVDADIATDSDIQCNLPCPPAAATCDCVRSKILDWLGASTQPARLILCIPSKETEAWVLCALHPRDKQLPTIECRGKPASLLVGKKPKLVRKKRSKYDKDEAAYLAALDALTVGWTSIEKHCTQGQRFLREIRAAHAIVRTAGRI
jgi:hypothetical protein